MKQSAPRQAPGMRGKPHGQVPPDAGPTGYRYARVRRRLHLLGTVAVPLTVNRRPAPRRDRGGGEERPDVTGSPFVSFAETSPGSATSCTTATTAITD